MIAGKTSSRESFREECKAREIEGERRRLRYREEQVGVESKKCLRVNLGVGGKG